LKTRPPPRGARGKRKIWARKTLAIGKTTPVFLKKRFSEKIPIRTQRGEKEGENPGTREVASKEAKEKNQRQTLPGEEDGRSGRWEKRHPTTNRKKTENAHKLK